MEGKELLCVATVMINQLFKKTCVPTMHGNFLALLKFRIQAGDTMLQDHLLNSAGNALYTSKTIQNELITICGDLLLNAILKKVRTTRFFPIIADEATDAANDEQLSICIRFVDGTVPCEKFIAFHECLSGVSGEAIADKILTKHEISATISSRSGI